jgi:hypothetical protein
MMKKLLVTALVVLGLVIVSGMALGAPHMRLSETEFNFGYVPQHSKISHDFWIYSDGDDTLKIIKVVPG